VRHLALTTASTSCPYLIPPPVAAPIVEYRYSVLLSQGEHVYQLDQRDFKYGPGDIDRFLVDLSVGENAIYRVRLAFDYRYVATNAEWAAYRSAEYCLLKCFDSSLPEPSSVMSGGGLPGCADLGYYAFEYLRELLTDPAPPLSKERLGEFINANYPCSHIRAEYVDVLKGRLAGAGVPTTELEDRLAAVPACPPTSRKVGKG
jgi:hypothetical protein